MYFLLEASANDATQWILPVVLLVLVVGIFILNYFRSKKSQENMKNMVDSLKVGDNVKTYSGLYGKIIEIVETTDGKVAILETGSEKNKGIFSIDINAIYGIDEKKLVIYDAEGNIIEPEEEKTEDNKEQVAESTKTIESVEQKSKKKGKKNKEEILVTNEPKLENVEADKESNISEGEKFEEKDKIKKSKKTSK